MLPVTPNHLLQVLSKSLQRHMLTRIGIGKHGIIGSQKNYKQRHVGVEGENLRKYSFAPFRRVSCVVNLTFQKDHQSNRGLRHPLYERSSERASKAILVSQDQNHT